MYQSHLILASDEKPSSKLLSSQRPVDHLKALYNYTQASEVNIKMIQISIHVSNLSALWQFGSSPACHGSTRLLHKGFLLSVWNVKLHY